LRRQVERDPSSDALGPACDECHSLCHRSSFPWSV
jgi:hypothetical protein